MTAPARSALPKPRAALLAAALLALTAAPADACDPSGTLCTLGERSYRVLAPVDDAGARPLVVFLHGAFASSKAMIDNPELVRIATEHGAILAAPDGEMAQFRDRAVTNWKVRDGRDGFARDEAFLRAVVEDVSASHAVDPDRILLAGFSRGASFVWDVACTAPDGPWRAYAPIAGGFWHPLKTDCAGPVDLLHTHGWVDKTVPLEGRMLGSGVRRQSDIFAGLEVWRAENGCADHRADAFAVTDAYWRRRWEDCTSGRALELALHPGTHRIPAGWTDMAMDWFAALPARETNEAD